MLVAVRPLQGWRNFGGFEAYQWAYTAGIVTRGYVRTGRNDPIPQKLQDATGFSFNGLRQQISERIHAEPREFNGVLSAVTVAHRGNIEARQREVFQYTGIAHLLAISGLHVGLMAGLCFVIVGGIWRWFGDLDRYPVSDVGWAGALIGACGYAAMTSWAISTRRALVMLVIFALLHFLRHKVRPLEILGFTVLFVLVALGETTVPLMAGFWLSFSAVAILMIVNEKRRQLSLWALQWAITLGLLPLSLLIFGQVSVSGLIANLIAIPWVSFTTIPLALLGAFLPISAWQSTFFDWADFTLRLLWPSMSWLASQPWSVWRQGTPAIWAVLLYAVGIVLLLYRPFHIRHPLGSRVLGVGLLIPLFFSGPARPPTGNFDITVLEVGEGLSTVVHTRRHTMIYDTGPRPFAGPNGGTVLLDYLHHRGVKSVDRLILSHEDSQHIGGTATLLTDMAVNDIFTGAPDQIPTAERQFCEAGLEWTWDEVHFAFLHPERRGGGGDDFSCLLKVTDILGQSALFTGDLSASMQGRLASQHGTSLAATWVMAPNQGRERDRRPIWHPQFLAAVAPKIIVFSTQRPTRAQSVVMPYNVAEIGATQFLFRTEGVIPRNYGERRRYFWPKNARDLELPTQDE